MLAIHPNQLAAARDRFRAGGGKDDRFDAMVLCELARTDRHRFPALAPCGDETLALRALVRTREDLVAARVALANQLRSQLDAFWPGAGRIFAEVDSPIALAFLARYPSPRMRVVSGRSALQASSRATPTAGADRPASCLGDCTAHRGRASASSGRRAASGRARPGRDA